MRLVAAITGSLREQMAAEMRAGARATSEAMALVTEGGKEDLRRQTRGAGLGNRLALAWRSAVYPKGEASLSAAGLIWSKAPKLHAVFADGAVIRANRRRFLAIPTEATPLGRRGRKLTPAEWPVNRFGPLRFVPRKGGHALLVADDQRQGKRGFSLAGKRARAKGEVATVVMFVLVPQVRLRKRLDLETVERTGSQRLPSLILERWEAAARAGR